MERSPRDERQHRLGQAAAAIAGMKKPNDRLDSASKFVEILKKRYAQPEQTSEQSPYGKFKASEFISCVSVEEDLSATYK